MLSALEAAPAPDYSATLNDQSRPLRDRLAVFGRAVAAEHPGDTEELAMYLEFFAALLRAPDALQRYSSGRERRLSYRVSPGSVWLLGTMTRMRGA